MESSGALTRIGTYQPPVGARLSQSQIALVPFDSEVVAFFFEGTDSYTLKYEVHSSSDFATNLAASLPAFSSPSQVAALAAYRPSGGNVSLYIGNLLATYVTSLSCATAPSPATASLAVENVSYTTGAATAVSDGGAVFIGDKVRVKTSFSPPDTVKPLLDWRLDYDFHDGATLDSNGPTFRLAAPDLAYTSGSSFPTERMLIGPCDPAQTGGGTPPDPATGTGCWTSVTTNAAYTAPLKATADFDAAAPVDTQLTVGFEVRNALNPSTSVAKHRITWKVPRQLLKGASILSGGTLEDASEGSPSGTYRWYFAQVPVGETGADVLTLETGCTTATCTPAFVQAGQTNPGLQRPGSYRYWVSVPYRGGFQTAECPGLQGDQVTCSGDPAKLVSVTDVVLSLSAPTQVLMGSPTIPVTSSSKQGLTVGACPGGTNGFSYNFCEVGGGGSCPEGAYSTSGVSVSNPFPTSGTGSISIPRPSEGMWGLRIKYSYTTAGNCGSPQVAQWPASGYAPVTVVLAVPTIRLRNSTDTADLPKSLGIYWELTTGVTARAYAELNGVRDTAPPSGLSWSYRIAGSSTETPIGTTQGAAFAISTAGDYEVVLRGYGADVVTANLGVAAPPSGGGGGGGGGGGTAPTVASVTASNYTPAVGQTVFFSCNATQGTNAITSYDWVLDWGVTRTTSTPSTSYAYTSSGTKTFACTANDSAGLSSATRQNNLTVSGGSGGGGGACGFVINNAQGARISYDSSTGRYDAASGQPLTFVASGTTSSISWNFGDGGSGSGNNATHTYNVTQVSAFTVTMTSGSCSVSYPIDISPPSGPTFTVSDADTGTLLANPTGAWEARAGQRLRFTASGATGTIGWAFGDGETSSEASPVKTYNPAVDTTYTVTLTSTGQSSRQASVAVKGLTGAPLTGNFTFRYSDGTAVNRSAVQPNKAITFTGSDQANTYEWDFGDGSSSDLGSPKEHTFTRGGTFLVKLTVTRGVAGSATTPSPLSFTVLAPPDPLLWVAAGMAAADGAGGARWQSDLSIFNPGTQTATVSLGFVAGSSWDGATKVSWIQQALVAGETKSYTNVLENLFRLSKPAWGVVLVRGDSVPVSPVIVSRTYDAAFAATTGTFGLSVPAMSVAAGVRPQSAAGANILAGLRHDNFFRTNLTVANLKDEEAQVEVVFRDAFGTALGVPAKLTVEARGVKQLNSALSAAPESPIGGAGYEGQVPIFSAEVKLKKGSGVYPYATVIDMGTNDSIVVTPAPRPSSTYRLPGIVRTATWKSDVVLVNPSSKERKVKVTFSWVRSGTTARQSLSDTLTFGPWQSVVAVDFVKIWLERQGTTVSDEFDYVSSFVDIAPASDDVAPTEPLIVNGKTYTASGAGTSGLQVDPYVFEDGIAAQAASKKILLSGLEANAEFRTNVALFLTPGAGTSDTAEVDVVVKDSFGRTLRSIYVKLTNDKPVEQIGSDTLFAGLTTTDAERASIVINNPRGAARVGAYATVIDRKSLDATFVAGQPVP
jgi:PKD repeat protein